MNATIPDDSGRTNSLPCANCNRTFRVLSDIRDFDLMSKMRSNIFSSEAVKRLVEEAEAEMKDYESDMQRLKSKIFLLESMKSKLSSHIKMLKCLQSPIRKLPREILAEIFLHLYKHSSNEVWTQKKTRIPAKSLDAVCLYWRAVAHSTPELWSKIDLALCDQEMTQAHIVKSILSLSKAAPLDVKLSDFWTTKPEQKTHKAITALVEQSFRWRTFTSDIPFNLLYHALPAIRGQIPSLQELTLEVADGEERFVQEIDYFDTAPNLTKLTLTHGYPVRVRLSNPPIKHLSLFDCPLESFLNMLRKYPDVVSAEFSTSTSYNAPHRECELLESGISSLTLSSDHEDHENSLHVLSYLFSHLRVPALTSLNLNSSFHSKRHMPLDDLSAMLTRSGCHIKTLSTESHYFSADGLISLMTLLPQLQELVIIDTWPMHIFNNLIISRLVVDEVSNFSDPLLPQLRSLNINCDMEASSFNDSNLLRMIMSRGPTFNENVSQSTCGTALLKSVRLSYKQLTFSSTFIESLRHLATLGLFVTLEDRRGFVL